MNPVGGSPSEGKPGEKPSRRDALFAAAKTLGTLIVPGRGKMGIFAMLSEALVNSGNNSSCQAETPDVIGQISRARAAVCREGMFDREYTVQQVLLRQADGSTRRWRRDRVSHPYKGPVDGCQYETEEAAPLSPSLQISQPEIHESFLAEANRAIGALIRKDAKGTFTLDRKEAEGKMAQLVAARKTKMWSSLRAYESAVVKLAENFKEVVSEHVKRAALQNNWQESMVVESVRSDLLYWLPGSLNASASDDLTEDPDPKAVRESAQKSNHALFEILSQDLEEAAGMILRGRWPFLTSSGELVHRQPDGSYSAKGPESVLERLPPAPKFPPEAYMYSPSPFSLSQFECQASREVLAEKLIGRWALERLKLQASGFILAPLPESCRALGREFAEALSAIRIKENEEVAQNLLNVLYKYNDRLPELRRANHPLADWLEDPLAALLTDPDVCDFVAKFPYQRLTEEPLTLANLLAGAASFFANLRVRAPEMGRNAMIKDGICALMGEAVASLTEKGELFFPKAWLRVKDLNHFKELADGYRDTPEFRVMFVRVLDHMMATNANALQDALELFGGPRVMGLLWRAGTPCW